MEAGRSPEDPPEQRADNTGRTRPASYWPWWWLLFVLIYLLSPGPATRLAIKVPSLRRAYTTVYAPIGAACSYCHPVASFYQWYVFTLWRADWNTSPTTPKGAF